MGGARSGPDWKGGTEPPDSPTLPCACAGQGIALDWEIAIGMVVWASVPNKTAPCGAVRKHLSKFKELYGLPLCACGLGTWTAIRLVASLFSGGASRQNDNEVFHDLILQF